MQLFLSFTLLFLAVFTCSTSMGQGTRRVTTQLLDPRKYPDDARRYVKPPDWNLFSNQTHFTAFRRFRMNEGKLMKFAEDFDRYTKTFDLGDVVWPNSSFLTASNIPAMVEEMRRRKLFLYQIWGYVPGSGPGVWHQFKLSDSLSTLFETKLGARWLGMDMGEQDGRYLLAYAKQMVPFSADRQQQYFNFHRHMERIGSDSKNKLAGLTAVTYAHYLAKEGIYTLIGSEAAQMHPNGQVFYSFNRGAGKQYGVPWFGNASVYNRWGWKAYDRLNSDSGPLKGTSLSLMKRLLYSHILYNCMIVGFENGWFNGEQLSPVGRIQQAAQQWVRQVGQPGVMQTPVAVMTDFYSGWIFPNYNNIIYKVWGNLPYGPGDYLTNNVFDLLYPGYQNSSFFHDEKGFATATPYGDVADALLSDAPGWIMARYPTLIVAGELTGGQEIQAKLQAYVEQGGHLFITAGSLKNLPTGLSGIACRGEATPVSVKTLESSGKKIHETQAFTAYPLRIPANATVLVNAGKLPMVIRANTGKGQVTVFASPFGLGNTATVQVPVKQNDDQELPNPYPLLNHVRQIVHDELTQQKLFDVGTGLSFITCRKEPGLYTIGISNNGWTALPFKINSHLGTVESITELPLNQSEKKEPGYVPEGLATSGLLGDPSTTISGGDIRIFRVKIHETSVAETSDSFSKPILQTRLLPLRELISIQEEVLKRPTFFQHYTGVSVDGKYVNRTEAQSLRKDSLWLALQKTRIVVDLSSSVNLFPDYRLVNNIEPDYQESLSAVRNVLQKMVSMGAKDLILTLHGEVENNITIAETRRQIDSTLHLICQDAASKNILVHLRIAPHKLAATPKEGLDWLNRLNEPNLKLAVNMAMLIDSKQNSHSLAPLLKDKVGVWLLSAPAYDSSGRLVDVYGQLQPRYRPIMADLLTLAPGAILLHDAFYSNRDREYEDTVELAAILLRMGDH